jgi:hypothetical protein
MGINTRRTMMTEAQKLKRAQDALLAICAMEIPMNADPELRLSMIQKIAGDALGAMGFGSAVVIPFPSEK